MRSPLLTAMYDRCASRLPFWGKGRHNNVASLPPPGGGGRASLPRLKHSTVAVVLIMLGAIVPLGGRSSVRTLDRLFITDQTRTDV